MKRIPVAGLLVTAMACALAQQKFGADGIAEYRKMLEDGNPSDLFEARGEELWKKKRGPKNASFEQRDLPRPKRQLFCGRHRPCSVVIPMAEGRRHHLRRDDEHLYNRFCFCCRRGRI